MISALYLTNMLSWILIVLAHRKKSAAGRHVTPLGRINLILNHPAIAYSRLYCMLSGEADANSNLIVFRLTRAGN